MKLECARGHEIDWDNCVIFDLEYSNKDIIEIGALKIKNGEVIDSFSTLVLPDDFDINYNIMFNGISEIEIENNGIPTKIALKQFSEFIEDLDLVAHSAKRAEIPVLKYTFDKYKIKNIKNKILDSKYFFQEHIKRKIDIESKRWSLEYLSEKLNINYLYAHRSLEDCKILLEAKNKILKLPDKFSQELNDKIQKSKWKKPNWEKEIKRIDAKYSFSISGTIENFTRQEIANMLINNGYNFDREPTTTTSYLIMGENPGKRKVQKAIKYNIKTIDWIQFKTMFLNNNE